MTVFNQNSWTYKIRTFKISCTLKVTDQDFVHTICPMTKYGLYVNWRPKSVCLFFLMKFAHEVSVYLQETYKQN